MNLEKPESFDREAFVESLNTPEAALENLKEAREFIEAEAGIKLTNIELFGLRRINDKVMKEVYQQEKVYKPAHPESLSIIDHRREVIARFFLEFYDINPSDLEKLYKDFGEETFKKFIKTKQESKHLP